MAKFFGASLFKKSSSGSSTNSPQMKKDSINLGSKNTPNGPTVMWDAICDLNSSSDLDDSADFFYSRSNIFSPKPDTLEKPPLSTASSSTNKWRASFLVPERQSRPLEHNPMSPSLSKFQSKPQNSPSVGFRYPTKFGKSTIKSPPSSTSLEIPEREPSSTTRTMNSPGVVQMNTRLGKEENAFVQPQKNLEVPSVDLDLSEEHADEGDQYQNMEVANNGIQKSPSCKDEVELSSSDGTEK